MFIQDPDFIHPGSQIFDAGSNNQTGVGGRLTLYVATNFSKLKNILILNRYRIRTAIQPLAKNF
jgi:hypothetical protein